MSEVPMTLVEWFVFAEKGRHWFNNTAGVRSYERLPEEVMHKMRLLDAATDANGNAHIDAVGSMYIDQHDHEACYIIFTFGGQDYVPE